MAFGLERGEGVQDYESFRVRQRGAGANLSVDIGMSEGAYIRGDAVALQGEYFAAPHSATINEVVGAADPTNPRIDRAILELKDNVHDASGSNLAQTRIVAGTPTGGATLDNLSGVAAVPASAILLADFLVPALATTIVDANIRDRRPFIAGVPPLLTDIDQIGLVPHPALATDGLQSSIRATNVFDLGQGAILCYLPRRIVAATRIRWRYRQGATAATGTYVFGLFDASGRRIVDTGSVAFTGALNSNQVRSETIAATTLEAGWCYLLFGVDFTNAGTVSYAAAVGENTKIMGAPNVSLINAAGGVTVPTTILGLSDTSIAVTGNMDIPLITLSVG